MASSRGGFTLVEILVAIVILGTVGVGLAQSMVIATRRAADSGAMAYRAAALNSEVSRVTALPATGLADGTTTRTVTSPSFSYSVTTVASTSGSLQTVTITVTPAGTRAISARARTITRAVGASSNPFAP